MAKKSDFPCIQVIGGNDHNNNIRHIGPLAPMCCKLFSSQDLKREIVQLSMRSDFFKIFIMILFSLFAVCKYLFLPQIERLYIVAIQNTALWSFIICNAVCVSFCSCFSIQFHFFIFQLSKHIRIVGQSHNYIQKYILLSVQDVLTHFIY